MDSDAAPQKSSSPPGRGRVDPARGSDGGIRSGGGERNQISLRFRRGCDAELHLRAVVLSRRPRFERTDLRRNNEDTAYGWSDQIDFTRQTVSRSIRARPPAA